MIWIIAGLYLSLIITTAVLYINNYSGADSSNRLNLTKLLTLPLAWTSLLVVEGILLWMFRATMNQPQAWIHVACMFGCFILTFLFTMFANFYIARFHGQGDAVDRFRLIYKINQYSFWAFFIMGHIFFISVIVQRFNKNNKIKSDEPSTGILDEFAD